MARLKSGGMARALFATALAQVLVAVFALVSGMGQYDGNSVTTIVNINVFFVAIWIASALLFQKANRDKLSADSGLKK